MVRLQSDASLWWVLEGRDLVGSQGEQVGAEEFIDSVSFLRVLVPVTQ